jgi:hypothetical protein
MYFVQDITNQRGELTAMDYQAALNTQAAQGHDFVQAIPQGIGRAILIFWRNQHTSSHPVEDGIVWLTDLINNSDKGN